MLKMNAFSRKRTTCRLCGSVRVEVAVPLSPIPIATPNIDLGAVAREHAGVAGVSVPLDLYLCRDCGHLQILDVVDPGLQYTNFTYTTSISLGLPEHFRRLADELIASVKPPAGALVVEIGSNDGTLLRAFKERGLAVLGIDPARETARRASDSGIETLGTFFTRELAEQIVAKYGAAAIVIANNTYANLDDLAGVTQGIERLLAPDGVFVFETSYGADVIDKFLLDTVYHEHLSYFMVRSLPRFFKAHGLELYDVQHIWTKGGSLRGLVQRAGGARRIEASVAAMSDSERAAGLDDLAPYRKFADRLVAIRDRIAEIVADHRRRGLHMAGYGASVGTVTLLQQFGLGNALDFIADDKPLTDAVVGPDYRIPVLTPQALYERRPALVFILAWRYAEPIVGKHGDYVKDGGRFVVPMPELTFM